jgi:hypothetical protein
MENKLRLEAKARLKAEMELQVVQTKLADTGMRLYRDAHALKQPTEFLLKETKNNLVDIQVAAAHREAELSDQLRSEMSKRCVVV